MNTVARVEAAEATEPGPLDVALVIACKGENLLGIAHLPQQPAKTGVVIIVGGPQYRVGSHRQFVLAAREIADAGYPALRFDYRGMGDSEGDARDFLDVDDDIRAAIDALFEQAPGLREVVLWGLCDGASAAAYYAATDTRVSGLVLLNPWVRSESGSARAYLKHYYLQRLTSADFWKKLLGGKFDATAALRSLGAHLKQGLGFGANGASSMPDTDAVPRASEAPGAAARRSPDLAQALADGLRSFRHRVLVITSGRDLTAQEFIDATRSHRGLKRVLRASRVQYRHIEDSDHTFSRHQWRQEVERWTIEWLRGE